MDIARISTDVSLSNVKSQVGVAMLSKSMDVEEQTGVNLVNMIEACAMERSVNPSIGSNVDIFI
jgi:hypothetical protein